MFTFEIPFALKSKKNGRPIFRNKTTGKHFLGKSAQYVEFEKQMHLVLTAQKNRQGLFKPLEGDLCIKQMRVEVKGAQRTDLDNIIVSVLDCLQDSKIIQNDKQFKLIQNIWIIPHAGRDNTLIEIAQMPKKAATEMTVSELVESLKKPR